MNSTLIAVELVATPMYCVMLPEPLGEVLVALVKAYEIQGNVMHQQVRAEAVTIQQVEKEHEVKVQDAEILRRDRELTATVMKQAEFERVSGAGLEVRIVGHDDGRERTCGIGGIECAHVDRAFRELAVEHVFYLAQLEVVVGKHHQHAVVTLFLDFDASIRALEIKAVADFLVALLDGVLDLDFVDF